MPNPDAHLHELPEESLGPDDFLVERHLADAMPAPHWHDHVEINWVATGRIEYLLNGRRVSLLPRRIGVFWAAITHQTISVEDAQVMYCAYLPIGSFLSLPIDPEFRASVLAGTLVQAGEETPEDGYRMEAMARGWAGENPVIRQIWREEILLRLRRLSVEPRLAGGTAPAVPMTGRRAAGVRNVERMTAYIHENLSRPLDIAEIAGQTGLHPTNAQAAFRRVLGLTIAQYVRRQRLSLAMRLLTQTDLSISQIAHRAGYSSVTRLYDAFKTHLGRTPRDYRARVLGD